MALHMTQSCMGWRCTMPMCRAQCDALCRDIFRQAAEPDHLFQNRFFKGAEIGILWIMNDMQWLDHIFRARINDMAQQCQIIRQGAFQIEPELFQG